MLKRCSYSIDRFDYSYRADKEPPESLDNRHCHDNYEVLYVIDGAGRFMIEHWHIDGYIWDAFVRILK